MSDEKTSKECCDSGQQSQQLQLIKDFGEVISHNAKHIISCLSIIGQVEGHYILPSESKSTKYEHIIPALAAIEQDRSIQGLLILLNTAGGDVEAGLAIAELISGMRIPKVSLVVGGGHSIGVPLAVSADCSFIVRSAAMTIHPVRMNGPLLGVPQTLSCFERIQDRIIRFVTSNSHISEEKFRELMLETRELVTDVGTLIDGETAVETGLIDRLGGISDALDCLYGLIEERGERYPDSDNEKNTNNTEERRNT